MCGPGAARGDGETMVASKTEMPGAEERGLAARGVLQDRSFQVIFFLFSLSLLCDAWLTK